MPSKGRYTAGKQVSRWEADSDNIDIEYKNLESQTHTQSCTACTGCTGCAGHVCPISDKKGLVIKVLSVVVAFGVGLVLGYVVRKSVGSGDSNIHLVVSTPDTARNSTVFGIQQDYDREFSQTIQDDLENSINFDDHLNTIIRFVHMSGVGTANKVIAYVESTWRTYPFDAVNVKQYNVSLSYPDYTNADSNSVTVQTENGSLLFRNEYNITNTHPDYLPFNAYSPSATVITDNVVYAHYGRREDFEELNRLNVSVNGSLLIIRYGRIHTASKVKNAERRGAIGVILYSDPEDYANNQTSVYPHSWWLPSWAVQMSHVRYELVGDPGTPDYSSISGVYSIPESSANFPKIPVQPIRYSDAKFLLSDMAGPVVSDEWFGGLNITYNTGPGYSSEKRKVQLAVHNILQRRNITNLVAVIKGHFETDKYVIVGAHVDSWVQGAVDSGTGYAVLQELARSFAYHIGKGWRPRRTIMFALWDGSKYGHVGAYEWSQEYEQQLISGAVAYINLDSLIQGNYSFSAAASSMLHSVIMKAAQTVSVNCSSVSPCDDNSTLFDLWKHSFPNPNDKSVPRFESLGDNSDHAPFIYRLGIPTVCPYYTYNKNLYPSLPSYPAFGTLDDTKDYLLRFIDTDYSLHSKMAKVLADIILRLSDSAVLPLDVETFVGLMKKGRELIRGYESVLISIGAEIDTLNMYMDRFTEVATNFSSFLAGIDRSKMSEFELYLLNDQLLQLPRAFITDRGLPGQPQYKNVLVAPDPEDLHQEVVLPGITRMLIEGSSSEQRKSINEQIAYLIVSLKRAIDIITHGMTS